MLKITIPSQEVWDDETNRMYYTKEVTLRLEHSLISISEWESKWCKPFFEESKTDEELLDYIRCMTIDKNIDPTVYNFLTRENIEAINAYIAAPMTATVIKETPGSRRKQERITSEVIYYWMISFQIPVEFEKWHINRLIMLIRVCSEYNKPNKKMSRREIFEQNKALNAARRARLGTKG